MRRCPAAVERFTGRDSPFEFRSVQPLEYLQPKREEPRLDVWFRTVDKLGDDDQQHRCLLAYVSDYYLIGTAMRPHGYTMASPGVVVASIDHAMWFHRPMRVDDWLLYSIESPSASGARGFARASLFARDGRLVASTAQEGLLRVMPAGKVPARLAAPGQRPVTLGLLDHLEVIAGRIDAHADQDAGLAEFGRLAHHFSAGRLDRP